jgi:phosphoribosylformimino-5-aminoimidazole carboxamide ribotide isomerase
MAHQVQVKDIDLGSVWQLRKRVLYPDQNIDQVKLEEDPMGTHLGVYLNNLPVSVISFFEHQGSCQFRKFATLPEYQGRGYGSLLLQHILTLAENRSAARIWCNARTTACSLYERFGMRPVGDSWEKNGHTFVKMEKQLNPA